MTDFKIGDRVHLPVGTIVGLERIHGYLVAKVRIPYGSATETRPYAVDHLTLVAETSEAPPLLPAGTVVRWAKDGPYGKTKFRWQMMEGGGVVLFDIHGETMPERTHRTGNIEYFSRMVREGEMEVVDLDV